MEEDLAVEFDSPKKIILSRIALSVLSRYNDNSSYDKRSALANKNVSSIGDQFTAI
jgi:hypothetical protein